MTFKSVTLVDQVAKALKDDILNGKLLPGDQLLEDVLKTEFSISRSPLREAFRVLEKEGLVEILPWRGAFVRRIRKTDIEENFPIRANLEGLAARLAHRHLTHSDIDEMKRNLEEMKISIEQGDFVEYSKFHLAFHDIFVNACRNQKLISLIQNLRMCTLWHTNVYRAYADDFENPLRVHEQIIALFQDTHTPSDLIEQTVRDHIIAALDPFLASIEHGEG